MNHPVETSIMNHLHATVAIYWWRAVKHFGRINLLDLTEGSEAFNRADLEILKQSGVVSFQTDSDGTFVIDEPDIGKMVLYRAMLDYLCESERPLTLTSDEYSVVSAISGADSMTVDECKEFMPDVLREDALKAIKSLVDKRMLVVEDDTMYLRFMGRESSNEHTYDLKRTERIYLYQHFQRWSTRNETNRCSTLIM